MLYPSNSCTSSGNPRNTTFHRKFWSSSMVQLFSLSCASLSLWWFAHTQIKTDPDFNQQFVSREEHQGWTSFHSGCAQIWGQEKGCQPLCITHTPYTQTALSFAFRSMLQTAIQKTFYSETFSYPRVALWTPNIVPRWIPWLFAMIQPGLPLLWKHSKHKFVITQIANFFPFEYSFILKEFESKLEPKSNSFNVHTLGK